MREFKTKLIMGNDKVCYLSSKPYHALVVLDPENKHNKILATQIATCKDRIHEGIDMASNVNNWAGGHPNDNKNPVDLDRTRLATLYTADALATHGAPFKRKLFDLKLCINEMEEAAGWKKSLIQEVGIDHEPDALKHAVEHITDMEGHVLKDLIGKVPLVRAFLWTADKRYMLNSFALHAVMFIFRYYPALPRMKEPSLRNLKTLIRKANTYSKADEEYWKTDGGSEAFGELQKKAGKQMAMFLRYWKSSSNRIEEGILDDLVIELMRKHDEIFEGVSIADFVASENGTGNHHGGYGLAAALDGKVHNDVVRPRVAEIMKNAREKE